MNPFSVSDIADSDLEFTPPANGRHSVKIVTSDDRQNKAGTGRYVLVEFKILSGDDAGKRIKDYCTHQHPSASAVAAGMGRLKRIMLACGLSRISDETDLLGLCLDIETEVEELPEDSGFKPQARAKKYLPTELESGNEEAAF
jgi:hypothetical protein